MHEVQTHRLTMGRYLSPVSVAEALRLLAEHGSRARLVAGGTDLLLEMIRGQRPGVDTLIDVNGIAGLDTVELGDDEILVGATASHNQIASSDLVVSRALPLAQASWEVGSPQLRNRATVAGNVITASPANDTISALRVLGTTIEVASIRGTRSVGLADFHRGVRKIDLAPDEMVTGLRVRVMKPSERGIFVKLGLRRAQAISVVHLAIVIDLDGEVVRSASIALGSVAPTIIDAADAATFLMGKALVPDVIAETARLVAQGPKPIDDLRGTAWYRTEQLRVLTSRALQALADNRQSEQWPANPVTLGGQSPRRARRQLIDLSPVDPMTASVNGQSITAAGAADRTLLDWLRDRAGPAGGSSLTGTKEGCAEGECGACTVLLDGMAVMSCLVPAGGASGGKVVTVEGLARDGQLHPLQQAFLDQGAVQCGFCIPGFLVSGASLLAERSQPTDAEIRTGFSGNLCRCTGYYRIIAAVEQAALTTS